MFAQRVRDHATFDFRQRIGECHVLQRLTTGIEASVETASLGVAGDEVRLSSGEVARELSPLHLRRAQPLAEFRCKAGERYRANR